MSYDAEPQPDRGRQTSGRQTARPAQQRSRDDYIEVKDRVVEFYSLYPEGRIECRIIRDTSEESVMQATVYRTAEGGYPAGMAHSSLAKPGATAFTRGSELENAETSAVGRALAFAGISAHRGIATMSEILAKRGASPTEASSGPQGPESGTEPTPRGRGPRKPPEAPTEPVAAPTPAPVPDPALVDPATGEVVGLTKEEFGARLREALIPVRTAQQTFERLYPGEDPTRATPAQRLAVLDAATAEARTVAQPAETP